MTTEELTRAAGIGSRETESAMGDYEELLARNLASATAKTQDLFAQMA